MYLRCYLLMKRQQTLFVKSLKRVTLGSLKNTLPRPYLKKAGIDSENMPNCRSIFCFCRRSWSILYWTTCFLSIQWTIACYLKAFSLSVFGTMLSLFLIGLRNLGRTKHWGLKRRYNLCSVYYFLHLANACSPSE